MGKARHERRGWRDYGLRGPKVIDFSSDFRAVLINFDVRVSRESLTEFNKKLVDEYLDIPYVETKCGYACSDQ